jgi:zinc protease
VYAAGQMLALEHPGPFVLVGAYLQKEQGDKVEKALVEEANRLSTEQVSDKELEKAKNQLTAAFVFGLESVDGLAQQIGMSQITRHDPRAWVDAYGAYQQVTADDIQRVARKYLQSENLTIVVVPPAPQAEGGGGQ